MKIHFVAIGNELLAGKIKEANAFTLAEKIRSLGAELVKIEHIGDEKESFDESLQFFLSQHQKERADILIFSGGLGPTKDDLTKNFLADFFQLPLSSSEDALSFVQNIYRQKNRHYNQDLMPYHLTHPQLKLLANSVGFAPGILYHKEAPIFLTPGVPQEFAAMVDESILPFLKNHFVQSQEITHLTFHSWKVPESKIFGEVDPTLWDKLAEIGSVSSLPHSLGVDVGVKISAQSPQEKEEKISKAKRIVAQSPFQNFLWHTQEGIGSPFLLEELIIKTLIARNETLSLCESATAGLLAHRLAQVSGCSEVLKGSLVCYSQETKIQWARVDSKIIKEYSVYSSEVAKAMAQGVQKQTHSTWSLSLTGVAGPGPHLGHPAGEVHLGLVYQKDSQKKILTQTHQTNGNRQLVQERFARLALFFLWERLNS